MFMNIIDLKEPTFSFNTFLYFITFQLIFLLFISFLLLSLGLIYLFFFYHILCKRSLGY